MSLYFDVANQHHIAVVDARTDHVIVITRKAASGPQGAGAARGRQGGGGVQLLDVMFIGR